VSDFQDVIVNRIGDVDIITINRPGVRNALRLETYGELEHVVRETTARCLVITGADPAFCSGDDVRAMMVEGRERPRADPSLTPLADALLSTDLPVIAAVNGAAVGWGMELALLADIRIASERAKFGELFVLRGLCSDVAGLGRLAGAVGRELAAELLFTGDVIDAQRAFDIGLVGRVVAHDDLMPTAQNLASRIAANPPLAVQKLKAGLRRALDPAWAELGRWVTTSLRELFATEDHHEGVNAFLERRTPNYQGR
jgi:enoyl-CoA hydratase/carnithine racemase